LYNYAKELRVPFDLLQKTAELGRLPVVNFAAGGLGKILALSSVVESSLIVSDLSINLRQSCVAS